MDDPYKPPTTNVEAAPPASDIDQLKVSDTWKKRFHLMRKAGAYDGTKYRDFKVLEGSERRAIGFNFLAFLFSAFYYFAKGMPRKAFVIIGASWVLGAVLTVIEGMANFKFPGVVYWIPVAAVTGALASRDYYEKMVEHQTMWPGLKALDNIWASIGVAFAGFVALVVATILFVKP